MSSLSGTATAVLTVWRAEAVRDEEEVSESEWTVGKPDDEGMIKDISAGYKQRKEWTQGVRWDAMPTKLVNVQAVTAVTEKFYAADGGDYRSPNADHADADDGC